ncbi:MAG: aminotransferase class III-fold pyridoxal phosphate-dependent enzyme [Candidatus Omnitrophica bacterium]|nr:aminotransferase class III-fold pyridoxal phosphate-dependent enzyme [Candidatus Omnitrophota bacterium]
MNRPPIPTTIQNPKSKIQNTSTALKEAEQYLVGGVNSPVRAFRRIGCAPLMLVKGRGATVIDSTGRRYLDFIGGWGALILGHRHPTVLSALRRALTQDIMTGLTHPDEIALARLLTEAVPSVEQVRFTVSGTEACMTAMKLARAYTKRAKILMFDGCYHGHAPAGDVITAPFNDAAAAQDAIRRAADELACVMVEPVAANMGVVAPGPDFLSSLREVTSRCGVLLLFDEVVTGFRLGAAGAQGRFGIQPDLTTFGKIIGGGLPIGAVGGPARIMQRFAPEGDVYHGGTFAGHPLSMTAGIASLKILEEHPPYEHMERLTQQLAEGLVQAGRDAEVPVQVNAVGSMLTLFFSASPVTNAAQAQACDRDWFGRWARALLEVGILVPPSPFEALFLSSAHTEEHVSRVLDAARRALLTVRS